MYVVTRENPHFYFSPALLLPPSHADVLGHNRHVGDGLKPILKSGYRFNWELSP